MTRRMTVVGLVLLAACSAMGQDAAEHRVLFIGNSYTARHNLSKVVQAMALAADPDTPFEVTTIIYGGQNLKNHWELYRSYNYLRLPKLSRAEMEAELAALRQAWEAESNATLKSRLAGAVGNHKRWVEEAGQPRPPFDLVVLQSWRDLGGGMDSGYAEYARKFAAEVRAQGGRPVLYVTTPETQNAQPLTAAPDPAPIQALNRTAKALGAELDALVVPMPAVAWRCQTDRPDLTLRYVNDGHPNQTMAYLTASTFFGVLYGRSPEGLPIDTITDTVSKIPDHPEQNPDGGPKQVTFDEPLRTALQKIAWQGLQDYEATPAP